MTHRRNRLKLEIYLQMNYFHMKLIRRRQYSSINKQMIGGSYIRPNRTSLLPYSERKKLVQEEHDKIMTKIKESLSKTCPSLPSTSPLFKQFSQRLHACLTFHYMAPLPYMDQIRAKQEREIVKSIRRKSKKGKLILRESDKSGNLYVGQKSVFEQKATEYRQQTGAYEELSSNPLEEILIKVTRLLNDLHMKTKYLSDPITLRPIMNTIHAATTGISHFLDELIRPLFNKHAQPKPIIDGNDLLHRLEQYDRDGYLQPTTRFFTSDITNLYTMLPQNQSLDILEEFLDEYHLENELQGISIEVIRQLAEIIVGGAMGSPFTLTLANIFMWKWENNIICKKLEPNEIYVRFIDDIFFTSNESKTTIEAILQDANKFHPNIKLQANIGLSILFLDLLISNNNGILSSSVYHKSAAEPCVVPFISDHPRHTFANIIQAALLRAIRYSSTLEIFHTEYRTIRLMLLYNGYLSKYIDTHFQEFFAQYLPISSLVPLIYDENQFLIIRNKLFAQPSVKEIQASQEIANIERKQASKRNKFDKTLFLHYTHENRLFPFKRDIHKIYSEAFQGADAANLRLIIGHRNSRNIACELIQKKPYSSFIKLQPAKNSNINQT
ncbi:unnamed protein product [Rotaria socialis]|uniref:Helix-turn-helix domain-containing protein n=1 Tax=Rotaria socialis TaxID=392032 RepID=A0A820VUY3_9BILA|nr:unnamed protein product [Rotaria socialis]